MNSLAEPAQGARSPDAGTFPSRRDVPLVPASSIAGRALVTVIAIMTFLASLAAGGAILVAGTSRTWQHAVGREMTVQVRPLAGRDIEVDVAKAVAMARATADVEDVEAFGKEQAEKLLEPWLGTGLDLNDLPVPRLIVVKVKPGGHPDLGDLRARLGAIPGASLDDHRAWLDRLATMADTLVAMSAVIFVLVLTAMGLAVAFATRGVMAGNREIIGILHFVGAEDRFIAREFQRHFLRLGLKGGLIGGFGACLAFFAAAFFTTTLADQAGADQVEALFGTFALGFPGYLAITAIALGIAFATGSMSRAIVFKHLRALS